MKTKKISLSIKISLLVMLISFFGIATLAYISFSLSKNIFARHSAQILSKNIDQYGQNIRENIERLKDNFTIFTYNPSVNGFLRSYISPYKYDERTNKTFNQYRKDIETIIRLMMKQNPAYYQMRIIDATNGQEILKLVRQNNKIFKIPQKELQNKWKKAYVQQPLHYSSQEELYLSTIDLNKEKGNVEFPIKPTIRISKAISINGKKVGIVVINANIKDLFFFNKLLKLRDTNTYIVNQEGEYLFNKQDPQKIFGFEFGTSYNIKNDFPFVYEFLHTPDLMFSYIDKNKNRIVEARKVFLTPLHFVTVVKEVTTLTFDNQAQKYVKQLVLGVVFITLFITFVTTISVRYLTQPIRKLTEIAEKISQSKGEEKVEINIKTNDEIEELAYTFKVMIEVLNKSKKDLENFAQRLEEEVEIKTEELQRINVNLQNMVEEKLQELREKDKALVQQSKMAAMGEMIGAIAHQWRQPLNSLAINIQMLEDIVEDDDIDEEFIEEFVKKNMETIQFMSHTIDDFRNFFRKDKEKIRFDVALAIEMTLNLQKPQFKNHNIVVLSDLKPAFIKGFKNEFMQTILNIISNAKDAIEEHRERTGKDFEGKIKITNEIKDGNVMIYIEDNGGGISDEIVERIFEPYFTTKEEGKGTGMGLYMVKEIIERMGGSIGFRNIDGGTVFEISLRLDDENKA